MKDSLMLARRVQDCIEGQGRTLNRVAHSLGVHRDELRSYVNRERPIPRSLLERLARELQVDPVVISGRDRRQKQRKPLHVYHFELTRSDGIKVICRDMTEDQATRAIQYIFR